MVVASLVANQAALTWVAEIPPRARNPAVQEVRDVRRNHRAEEDSPHQRAKPVRCALLNRKQNPPNWSAEGRGDACGSAAIACINKCVASRGSSKKAGHLALTMK